MKLFSLWIFFEASGWFRVATAVLMTLLTTAQLVTRGVTSIDPQPSQADVSCRPRMVKVNGRVHSKRTLFYWAFHSENANVQQYLIAYWYKSLRMPLTVGWISIYRHAVGEGGAYSSSTSHLHPIFLQSDLTQQSRRYDFTTRLFPPVIGCWMLKTYWN